jgi:hypothetical protein
MEVTPRTKCSYAMLEADSHAVRLDMLELERTDKTTRRIYERCLRSYREWWEQHQLKVVAGDSHRVAIPALPVTAAKVAIFLQHEMSREKKKVCVALFFLYVSLDTDSPVSLS